MVKVAFIDADSLLAGESIRILILHPETEIASLLSSKNVGRNASSVHHGLIGESIVNFSDKLDFDEIDLIILNEKSDISDAILHQMESYPNLKLVTSSKELYLAHQNVVPFEIGISEINRKALVRGAKFAYVPSPAIVPSLIALAPLANFLLLNSNIDISVSLPKDIVNTVNALSDAEILKEEIIKRQSSFNGKINLMIDDSNSARSAITLITLNNSLSIDEIEKIYDQIYDDHHFTFITNRDIDSKEVEGTQKIIIYLEKPNLETLKIKVVSDARMRGGAGDIVHILNLFFGLHELTGLHLKPSSF